MSAFFVGPATIDATVAAFLAQEGPLDLAAATALGRALWAMNAEAVRWRYDLDTGTEDERAEHAASVAEAAAYEWSLRETGEAVMAKALDCLLYQCCEGPVREVALYGRLVDLVNRFDASGVRDTEAYERAPWGLDEGAPSEGPEAPEAGLAFRSELTPKASSS